MFKRFFSLILILLMCCSLSSAASYQTEHSHAKGNDETIMTSDYVLTAKVDPDLLDRLFGASDEIISGSTIELLEYFLGSPFMWEQTFSPSSIPNYEPMDFSNHKAYRELITREDLLETLDNYAKSILQGSKSDEPDKVKFEKLLIQPDVVLLISDLTDITAVYPSLQSIFNNLE